METLKVSTRYPKVMNLRKACLIGYNHTELSVIEKAIVDASNLQQVGAIEDATEKWRSIANIAEEIDDGSRAATVIFCRLSSVIWMENQRILNLRLQRGNASETR